MNFQDGFGPHKHRAIDPKKTPRIEQFFQIAEALFHKKTLVFHGVRLRQAVGRPKKRDVARVQKGEMLTSFHQKTLLETVFLKKTGQRFERQRGRGTSVFSLGHALERPRELVRIDWFQQIIDGIYFESLHGILIESGGENDGRTQKISKLRPSAI